MVATFKASYTTPWDTIVDDGGKCFCQPCMGVDCVHFAVLDQRGNDGPVFCSDVVFAIESLKACQFCRK